jgi:hypothetical protein
MRVCCRRVYSACMTVGHHGYIMASRSRYPNTIESGARLSRLKAGPAALDSSVHCAASYRGGVGIRAFGCARSQRRCRIGPPTVGRKPYHKAPRARRAARAPRRRKVGTTPVSCCTGGTRGVYKLQKSRTWRVSAHVDVRTEVGGVTFIDFIERGAGGRATNPRR